MESQKISSISINSINANIIPIELQRNNYIKWKSLFLPIIREYVDGSKPTAAPQFLDEEEEHRQSNSVNPAFTELNDEDQALLIWILSTSQELWSTLERRLAASSTSAHHIIELRDKLQSTFKKENLSISEYLDHQIKQIAIDQERSSKYLILAPDESSSNSAFDLATNSSSFKNHQKFQPNSSSDFSKGRGRSGRFTSPRTLNNFNQAGSSSSSSSSTTYCQNSSSENPNCDQICKEIGHIALQMLLLKGRNLQFDSSEGGMSEASLKQKDQETVTVDERSFSGAKIEVCRYFESPGGCIRGAKCHFAHGREEEELSGNCNKKKQHVPYMTRFSLLGQQEMKHKIFVGGLPPSVDSETLEEFFEEKFGEVDEAVVIGSQAAGDHLVHSRGFGFVTFKHEESVAAAVQAHYITIWGKRVEIKGAVPKHILLGHEMTKFTNNENKPTNDDIIRKLESTSSSSSSSWVDKLLRGKQKSSTSSSTAESPGQAITSATSSVEQIINPPPPPSWVTTFRKWLPGFLLEVSKRLKEGEWYPLSSLKGDFRATCGLELDHTSLGYVKLSDFMRSFPTICRMKVVPVGGRGAATHMVLLPNLQQHQPSTSSDHPSVLVDDDEDDTNDGDFDLLLDGPHSEGYRKFGYVSSVDREGAGPGQQGVVNGNNGTNVASRFLQFLKWDPLIIPFQEKKGDDDDDDDDDGDDGREKQPKHLILKALSRKKTKFSFFAREFDFYKKYSRSSDASACFGCNASETSKGDSKPSMSAATATATITVTAPAVWMNKPCGHMVWCCKCKMWADRQAAEWESTECVICNAKVESCEFQGWGQHPRQHQHPNLHHDAPNEMDFPPLDPSPAATPNPRGARRS